MPDGVSVIVCCYNSVSRIGETLRHLAQQKISAPLPWEIIIVDNGSNDATAQVAMDYWKKFDSTINLSVVNEPILGLTHARASGMKAAKYDVIIFCDDDNWLSEQYVEKAYAVMMQNSMVAVVGGQGIAVTDGELPEWFEQYKRYYACYPQAAQTGQVTGPSAFLYGAGMAVRKSVINEVYTRGVTFLLTDRTGNSLASGGDTELCYLVRLLGYQLWYDDRLTFKHYMPQQRLTCEYLSKLVIGIGYSSMKIVVYQYVLSRKKVNRLTWLADVAYRVRIYVLLLMKTFFVDNDMAKLAQVEARMALVSVLWQFGKYRSIYKSLLEFKERSLLNRKLE